ncbi:MAG: alpha-L-rhamnosidase N-terminal domain-containing protein [Phycisphaeraceae bacterium]|nr:alpha-L-rhamnosidase N-terminal domain-containing protein [Phycisphaeraceae bacterium]
MIDNKNSPPKVTSRDEQGQTFFDSAAAYPVANWKAAWIWSARPTTGVHNYVYFRRKFSLPSVPAQVLLRLAAQRDATLWVNGELIAHGPPISDPRYQRYETHDVTAHLHAGENCIAIRVYHDTQRAALTNHAQARGLLCQLEADDNLIIATDESWRAHICQAYQEPVAHMGDSMWPEIFIANLDTPNWQTIGFDDTTWEPAKYVIAKMAPGWGREQPQARFFPWANLIPCETRPLRRIRHRPQSLLDVGEVIQQHETSAHDTAVRMSLEHIVPLSKATVINAESLLTGSGSVTIKNSSMLESDATFDGMRNAVIVLDFGKLMNARFGFRLSTSVAVIDIGYAYRLDNERVVPYVSHRTTIADYYVTRPGEQSWESGDWRHFRYVQLTFRDMPDELILEEVWAEELCNHFEYRGQFSCNDPKLDRVFEMIRLTTELNIVDRTMDNPSRERKQYLGDCSAIVPAITSCFGDMALLRRYFINAREGQQGTGTYSHSFPGHNGDYPSLFDHSLSLPLRLHEHYHIFADRSLIADMWPSVVRFLDLAKSFIGQDYMMPLPSSSLYFDWGHMDGRGSFLPLQAMTAQVMHCAADLAKIMDESPNPWKEIAQGMTAQIPRWFDERRGVFVDAIVEGKQQSHVSEHANSLVAMWHLAPSKMIQSALENWSKNSEQFGQTSPAWMYLPGAFINAGHPDLAVQWLHTRLDQIESQGLNTWPELWCLYGEKTKGTWRCRNSRAVAQGAGLGASTALL